MKIDYKRQTLRHSDTQTLRHSDTQTLRHSDTQTLRHSDTQTLRHSDTHNSVKYSVFSKFIIINSYKVELLSCLDVFDFNLFILW